ncbi:acyl-homoserine-lactone synthase [Cognatiyoonia sp. IB215182]|uniref:acyl-homoserine-lactone synthase n=1 Tax=Cognatiyoonia sp. IB215182 TaxID=3097353 RepID=UPI002A0E0021|nr:acyl-homoserine-lactone synthase [Cognatiyoonia sp. IB215182]MDX8355600.1 acyl-homoserine-lactone synthase [Cognatiyoonia sp. IB215182]
MIKFVHATNLFLHTDLAIQMFTDRADLFGRRLGWDVHVDQVGMERDEYDTQNPIYIIDQDEDGRHLSSMRLLPTTGRTMLNDHFPQICGIHEFSHPNTWEVTRFCVAPGADRKSASRLLAAGARMMKEMSIKQFVATFGTSMKRIYRRAGVSPEVVGTGRTRHGEVNVGIWKYSSAGYQELLLRSQTDEVELEVDIANSDICKRRLAHNCTHVPSLLALTD